jgi:[acyl-carrier-protein] S-malonyltransferase
MDKNHKNYKKIVLMFPGQGSQYMNMGCEFLDVHGSYREYFEISSKIAGTDLFEIIKGRGECGLLNDTRFSQILIYTLSCALNDYVLDNFLANRECIITVTGHSLGEYSALYSSGAYNFKQGAELVVNRGIIMSEANKKEKGMMAAVLGADICLIEEVLDGFKDRVFIANYNDYRQVVISGYENSVKEAIEKLKQRGVKKIIQLKVGIASHCPLMRDVSDSIGRFIDNNVKFKDIKIPLFSTTGLDYINRENIKSMLTGQLVNPVRWVEAIEYMFKKGNGIFVEIGPGRVLSGLVKRIARENQREVTILDTDRMEDIENSGKILKEKGTINEA